MSLSRNSEGGMGEVALRAAASFDAAKLEKGEKMWLSTEAVDLVLMAKKGRSDW